MPPFRLKLKYLEYTRLHHSVTGTSPKKIWEMLSQPWLGGELRDYIENTPPWFSRFVKKWTSAMQGEHDRLLSEAKTRYKAATEIVRGRYDRCELEFHELRKAFAAEFLKPENKEFSGILFAMLDDKDVNLLIWKKVKEMTAHSHPLRDSYSI